jgi:hypothetical protein
MKTAHTPGPWFVGRPDPPGRRFYVTNAKKSALVAELFQNEDDARLIAAAPDLLDLARNVAGIDSRYLHTNNDILLQAVREWLEQAHTIIAKAEGKS